MHASLTLGNRLLHHLLRLVCITYSGETASTSLAAFLSLLRLLRLCLSLCVLSITILLCQYVPITIHTYIFTGSQSLRRSPINIRPDTSFSLFYISPSSSSGRFFAGFARKIIDLQLRQLPLPVGTSLATRDFFFAVTQGLPCLAVYRSLLTQ